MANWQLALLFGFLSVFAWWLSMLAGRIDRVHIRKDEALTALRLQLAWRASAVAKVLTAGLLDPISREVLLAQLESVSTAAQRSLSEYLAAESELTEALCQVFDDSEEVVDLADSTHSAALLQELAASCRRVELARRFHNDAVGSAQLLRRRGVVKWFRLAGHTPWPTSLDLSDRLPQGLEQFS